MFATILSDTPWILCDPKCAQYYKCVLQALEMEGANLAFDDKNQEETETRESNLKNTIRRRRLDRCDLN